MRDYTPTPSYQGKIIWAELARKGNSFVVDENGLFTMAGSFLLTINDKTQDCYYLCSALNTPMALFYLEQVYTKLDDTGWQWKKDPLEKIPIPKITEFNKHIANEIIELTKQVHLQRDESLEKRIRECFYEIYNFDDEEKKFFETHFLTKGDI